MTTPSYNLNPTYTEAVESEENFSYCGACGEIYEVTLDVFNAREFNSLAGMWEYTHPTCSESL